MYRRDLLRLSAAAAAGVFLPDLMIERLLAAAEPATKEPAGPPSFNWDRTVVLIELRGGNDGLNTVIPFTDAAYYRARPNLAIEDKQVLPLSRELGFHPAMAELVPGWKEGELAIAHGLGYANPNRSHFRGIDIWQSASSHDEMLGDGWVARILAKAKTVAPAEVLADGIIYGYSDTVGFQGYGPLYGHQLRNITMNSADEFISRARRVEKAADRTVNATLSHLLSTQDDINKTAARMQELQKRAPALQAKFPDSNLSHHLQGVGRLLAAGAMVPIWKLTLDGFDTHAGQPYRHEQLLRTLAESVGAFRTAMKAAGIWDKILVMTYSEFGRRIDENSSNGTDHGTAAPHFLMGGKVKGGFYGAHPSLANNDNGDLIFTTDYRSMYQTVAQEWWGYKEPFLGAKKYKGLGCIRA
jgi:uncharacterized protein (DUF1501 family)